MESEPIELTLKDRKHALKLGTDFSKELGNYNIIAVEFKEFVRELGKNVSSCIV